MALDPMAKKTEQEPFGTLAFYRNRIVDFQPWPECPYPDNALSMECMYKLDQIVAEYNKAIDDAIELVAFHGGTVHLEAHLRQLKK